MVKMQMCRYLSPKDPNTREKMYLLMHFNASVEYPVYERIKIAASRLEMDSSQMGMRQEKSRVLRNKQINNNKNP